MPFTLAHAAAVVPLARLKQPLLVPTALAIGAMVPDLGHFISPLAYFVDSHTLLGLLLFCLPMGLVSYYCFYQFVSALLVMMCPPSLQKRLPPTWAIGKHPTVSVYGVMLSILLGAATHLLWDALTHDYGFIVAMFDVLATPLFMWGDYTVYLYRVVQHGSTALGMGLLLYWGKLWFNNTDINQPVDELMTLSCRQRTTLIAGLFVPPIIFGLYQGSFAFISSKVSVSQFQYFVGLTIMASCGAFICLLLLYGIACRGYLVRCRQK